MYSKGFQAKPKEKIRQYSQVNKPLPKSKKPARNAIRNCQFPKEVEGNNSRNCRAAAVQRKKSLKTKDEKEKWMMLDKVEKQALVTSSKKEKEISLENKIFEPLSSGPPF